MLVKNQTENSLTGELTQKIKYMHIALNQAEKIIHKLSVENDKLKNILQILQKTQK